MPMLGENYDRKLTAFCKYGRLPAMRILLIEDDLMLSEALTSGLERDGYAVDSVARLDDAIVAIDTEVYACILLDLGLPDGDGLTVLSHLRAKRATTPAIIMSARDQLDSKVIGLDAGADDYLVKPFDLHELKARIRAACRRGSQQPVQATLVWKQLELDVNTLEARYNGQDITLSSKEFRLLQRLVEAQGHIVSRDQLERVIYSWGQEIESNAIEVHLHRIRKKTARTLIESVRSVGYRMK